MKDRCGTYVPLSQMETGDLDAPRDSTQASSSSSSDIGQEEVKGENSPGPVNSENGFPTPEPRGIRCPSSWRLPSSRIPRNWSLASALMGALALSNLASLIVGVYCGRYIAYSNANLDHYCARHTGKYSPLLDDVDIHYKDTDFNGTFLVEDVYRLAASPEVDAAWEALGVDYRAGVITLEEGHRSGLTEAHVQRADQHGAGFFVNVEGMHHLHCLNLVRKSVYYNYQYYKDMGMHAFKNDESVLKLHISHCIDTLRQVLMCNVDTGVLGRVWYNPQHATAFPDFHTTHKCKNYDAVRQWAESLQAPPQNALPADYLKPAKPEHIWPATP